MPLLRETLGGILRELRDQRGLSLRQLGSRAEMSATYLGEVERGLKDLSSEMLEKLACALEVPPSDLLYRAGDGLLAAQEADAPGGASGQPSDRVRLAQAARQLEAGDLHTLARFADFLLSGSRSEELRRTSPGRGPDRAVDRRAGDARI
jgi:transcriptional regulator with XRE-family HTH domain